MTIEEELELIQGKRPVDPLGQLSRAFQAAITPQAAPETAPPETAPPEMVPPETAPPQAAAPETAPATPSIDTAAADEALGLPPREQGLTAPPEQDASTWDVIGAAWQAETIRTDAWNYTQGLRRDLTARMWAALTPEAKQRIADLKWDQQNNWMQIEDLVAAELAAQAQGGPDAAAALSGLPLSREAFELAILNERKAGLDEAQAVLDQPGGGIAEFLGAGARALTDQTSLMLLPFGVSGSALRTIAGEAVLGAVGEAAVLPREFEVARELDQPEPDAASRIALGAVLGGGLAASIIGGARAVRWARTRHQAARAATPEGVDDLDAEASIDAAYDQMQGNQTVAEVTSRPGPGTLGDIVVPSGTRARVVLVNQGATRRQPIQPALEANLSQAVGEVYGPGYTVQVYSGGQPSAAQGGPRVGTDRHDHGYAADVRIYGPDGRQLTGDALAPVIQYWLAKRIGGVGAEMQGGGLHLDLHTDRAPTWDYRADGGQLTPAQERAMQAGLRGELPRLGGTPGAGPVGRLPNTPGLSYNEDATITAIIGGESSFDPLARNPNSSAVGLGQILSGTWMELVQKHRPDLLEGRSASEVLELREDPALNREMTAAYARDNHAKLTAAGVQAGPGEIYLAHFLGPTGAIRVLQAAPETPISQLMTPKQIADNKGIRWQGRALADFRVFDLVQWSRNKVRSAYGDAPPAGAPAYTPTSRGYTGQGQVRVSDDMTIDVVYKVVDASSLTRASGEFQPRDRTRLNSDAWIADTAARLDPAQLMPSPNAATGAPIIGPDGMIESGNGRFSVITRAYDLHPDRATAYRSAIEAAGFAIPEGVTRPVLVAERTTELTRPQRIQMTIDAQDSGVAELTPTEKAMAFGRAMDGPRLARFNPAAALTDEANGDFVRAMLEALPKSARNAMVTPKGGLNRHGEQLLREAIFARAWDDPDMVDLFVETDPEELGGLMRALEQAVPEWAALKADIEGGTVRPEFDISGHILDAMRLINAARVTAKKDGIGINKALNDLLDTPDMLTGPVAPLTTALVSKFWRNGRAAPTEATAEFLTRYASDARKAGQGGGLFGDVTPRDVLRAIDADTFADLPEDFGPVRGYARKPAPDPVPTAAPVADQGFDAGASSAEAEALHQSIREDLEGPAAQAGQVATVDDMLASFTPDGPRQLIDLGRLDAPQQRELGTKLKEAQPYDTAEAVHAAAIPNHDELNRIAGEVAAELGLEFKPAPVKKLDRIRQKVTDKYAGNYRKIADVARTGVTAPTIDAADAFVAGLARRFHIIDEGWAVTDAGYFDRKLMVRFDDGQLGEIQVWPPGMLDAKGEGGGHKLYEISRDEAAAPEARAQAIEDMKILYGEVRDQLDPSFSEKLGFEAPSSANRAAPSASDNSLARSSAATSSASAREGADQALPVQSDAVPSGAMAATSDRSNTNNFMGDVLSNSDTPNIVTAAGEVNQAELAAARADLDAFFEEVIELPDGTRARAADLLRDLNKLDMGGGEGLTSRDYLDDLDADLGADALLQACGLGGDR